MKTRFVVAFVTATAVVGTALLYNPLSLAIFKIREPYFICPVKPQDGKITIRSDPLGSGEFGARRKGGRVHMGVDFAAPMGAPVIAAKSGIAFRGNVPRGYGKYVMIYHPDGYQTFYAHLSNWNVESSEMVKQGDVIGFIGKTGNAAHKLILPHVHFEIRYKDKKIDPASLMRSFKK